MVRDERYKLIWYPRIDRYQLFDLQRDPHETTDLVHVEKHHARVVELRGKLEAWFKAQGDPLFASK
jgi:hypothetical protein